MSDFQRNKSLEPSCVDFPGMCLEVWSRACIIAAVMFHVNEAIWTIWVVCIVGLSCATNYEETALMDDCVLREIQQSDRGWTRRDGRRCHCDVRGHRRGKIGEEDASGFCTSSTFDCQEREEGSTSTIRRFPRIGPINHGPCSTWQ